MSLKFSVVMPVFNTQSTLKKAIDSVLNQTYENVELLIINDGSTSDECELIIKSFDTPKIKYIKKESNEGLYLARKTGVERSSGDYILFLDSDDWLELDACKILNSSFKNKSYDYIEFSFYKVFEMKKKLKYKFTREDKNKTIENVLASYANHTIWNKAYESNLLKSIYVVLPNFYAVYNEDYYQVSIIDYYAKNKFCIDEPLYNYRADNGITADVNFHNAEKFKKTDLSLYNVKNQLNSFFKKEKKEYLNKYVNEFTESIYISFLKNTSSVELIKIIQDRFSNEDLILLLLKEVSKTDKSLKKIEVETSLFRFVSRPFANIVKLLKELKR